MCVIVVLLIVELCDVIGLCFGEVVVVVVFVVVLVLKVEKLLCFVSFCDGDGCFCFCLFFGDGEELLLL